MPLTMLLDELLKLAEVRSYSNRPALPEPQGNGQNHHRADPLPINMRPFVGVHACREYWDGNKYDWVTKDHKVVFVPKISIRKEGAVEYREFYYVCSRCGNP